MQVVVIGCGVVGAAIAYRLSHNPQLTVTVLDRQPPAQAATGAALGVLMGAISQKAKGNNLKMRLYGVETYNQWVPQLEATTERKIPFNQRGILRLCFEGEDLAWWQSLQTIRQTQGWPLEILDLAQLAKDYPHLNLEKVIGAVYSPSDRQIDPIALTLALVEAAQHRGVQFSFNSEVVDIAEVNGKVTLNTTRQPFTADWLIIAAGLGSTPLTAALQRPIDIRPVLGQAIQVRFNQPFPPSTPHPVITGNDVHLVPLNDQDYWIGATVEFSPATSNFSSLTPDPSQLDTVMHQAIALCPAISSATILRQWSGLRPRPEGRPAPIIELLPGYARILIATGHYRNGILLAPATAEKVCGVIEN